MARQVEFEEQLAPCAPIGGPLINASGSVTNSIWTADSLPDLRGRSYVVTGANRGLGLEVATALARHHAVVTLAVRDHARGQAAVGAIEGAVPGAALEVAELDLASLASIQQFADRYGQRHNRLDGLVNNAAAILVPEGTTAEGFELHWGVNHLGHFALTARLMPLLLAARSPRVVTVTSLVARWGRLRPGAAEGAGDYRPMRAYAASKLANLIFSLELSRRAEEARVPLLSIAAHPGYVRAAPSQGQARPWQVAASRLNPASWLTQGVPMGSEPILLAAAGAPVVGGAMYGPGGFLATRGHPIPAKVPRRARTKEIGVSLWRDAEASCGLAFELTPGSDPP